MAAASTRRGQEVRMLRLWDPLRNAGWLGLVFLVGFGAWAGESREEAFTRKQAEVQAAARRFAPGSVEHYASLERGFKQLSVDYPERAEPWMELLYVADQLPIERGLALAKEIASGAGAESARRKARGWIRRQEQLGKPVEFDWVSTSGTPVRSSALRGNVVALEFWATWCPPCAADAPRWRALYDRAKPKGFEIVGISLDTSRSQFEAFTRKERMTWPQVRDGKAWEGDRVLDFGVTRLPTVWLLDRKGRLRAVITDGSWDTRIQALLDEAPE
jgi:peroxiredoxin